MDISRIDLNLLATLKVLLEERNVTRAARRLHISQPGMSAQLARLRTLFGDPLLLPAESGRGMTPTALAQSLALPLNAALRELEQVVNFQPSFDPARDARTFNLAIADDALVALGAGLVARLHALAPHRLRFDLQRPQAERIVGQLESGEVDLLIDADRTIPPSLKVRTLLEDHLVMAQRSGHPRGSAAPDLDGYCALQHLLVSSAPGSPRGYTDEYLAGVQRQRTVVLSLPQLALVPQLLHGSDLVCTLPRVHFARLDAGLELYELPFPAPVFRLQMAWHPRSHFDPALVWLRELLQAAIHGEGQAG
ncbi:MAG TPA: LysR family transcriptional regulator [Pseudomonas sp.]|nr:LysR family transcriptional regulator [Pseudomonas sp.]